MIGGLVTWLGTGLFRLLRWLLGLLPAYEYPNLSGYLSGYVTYLGNLNWFVPVGVIAGITVAFGTALIVYNAYLIFSGWLKQFRA